MDTSQPTSDAPPPAPTNSAPASSAPKAAADPEETARDRFSLHQFLRTAILFGTVVLCLRAALLEPFGVPTGSMAPTLYGNHKECICPRCGYRVVIGAASNHDGAPDASRNPFAAAWCPNCYQGDLHFDPLPETAGDRLLVDKSAFDFRRPRRWEVAVFHNPSDLSKPYVKRVAGLPGEAIQIREGDVYVNGQLAQIAGSVPGHADSRL